MSEMVKFASQVDAEVLGKVRDIARAEGRQLQTVIDEALRDLIDKRASAAQPQADAMAIYKRSLKRYGSLYERLSK